VASVDNVNQWTKAGIMIRADGGSANAPHASVFATPTTVKGVAFQRRTSWGGESVHTPGPALAPPVWLRLTRTGSTITASYRKLATDPWSTIGSQTMSALSATVIVGLPVSSHVDGTLATATFDNVTISKSGTAFTSIDIGNVGKAGTTVVSGDTITIEGAGADIWGTADAFRFYYRPLSGNGSIAIRVKSVENTNKWAKAGVMFRETLSPGSKHVMLITSPNNNVRAAIQMRSATGGTSEMTNSFTGIDPIWLRVTRSDNAFFTEYSEDGTKWFTLGTVVVPMATDIYVGLPVTSHEIGVLATAVFDQLTTQP
jgi:regulation of enolase protein 1 (concanavalin A-like superfamily)